MIEGVQQSETDETERQIVAFIQQYRAAKGYSPTLEEIGEYVGMTKQGVDYHVRALLEVGVLHRQPGQPRTLTVVQPITEGASV